MATIPPRNYSASSTIAVIAVWFLVALLAWPLFGYAGYISRKGKGLIQKLGNAALGAAFVGKGLCLMTILPGLQTSIIWLAIALLLALLPNRTATTRLQGVLISAGLGIAFFDCMHLLVLVDSWRASTFTGK